MSDIVEVARFSSRFEANTALAQLQALGIKAQLVADDAGGALPSLTILAGGAQILVRAQDAEAAAEALLGLSEED